MPDDDASLTPEEREALKEMMEQQVRRGSPTISEFEPLENNISEAEWRVDFRTYLAALLTNPNSVRSHVDENVERAAQYADRARELYNQRIRGK